MKRSLVRKILDDFSWDKYKMGHLGREQLPRVVKFKNKYYIHDGHHRLTAVKLLKKKSAPVQLIDMDVKSKKKAPVKKVVEKFTPAKTMEELNDKMQNMKLGGFEFDYQYSTKDALNIGNQIVEHMHDRFAKFPGMRKLLDEQ